MKPSATKDDGQPVAVSKGIVNGPLRVVVYGPEGVGKTTFAAHAGGDVFVFDAEDGSGLLDVSRANVKSISQLYKAMDTDEAQRSSVWVFDTADWLETQFKTQICAAHRKENLEEFGFGKGHEYLETEWRSLMAHIRNRSGDRDVIFTAHHQVKAFHNPMGDDYDRYSMKLNKRVEAVLKEWSTAILFLNYYTVVRKADGKVVGMGDGGRMLYTERRPAYDAKNRYGLDPEIVVDYDTQSEIWAAMRRQSVDYDAIRGDLRELADSLPEDLKNQALSSIERTPDDARSLQAMRKWIEGKVKATNEQ